MDFSLFLSTALYLFLIINCIGQAPVFVKLLEHYEPKRQRIIIIREVFIAYMMLLLFTFFGNEILSFLDVCPSIISVAGGILLFLIAINLIFPGTSESDAIPEHEPLIVPLATPILAGPGCIAAVMLFATKRGELLVTFALLAALAVSAGILLLGSKIKSVLGDKGMHALGKLGGMLLALISIQMLANGIIQLVKDNFNI